MGPRRPVLHLTPIRPKSPQSYTQAPPMEKLCLRLQQRLNGLTLCLGFNLFTPQTQHNSQRSVLIFLIDTINPHCMPEHTLSRNPIPMQSSQLHKSPRRSRSSGSLPLQSHRAIRGNLPPCARAAEDYPRRAGRGQACGQSRRHA